jgi:hypothetical protein
LVWLPFTPPPPQSPPAVLQSIRFIMEKGLVFDLILGWGSPLCTNYPIMYELCTNLDASVAEVARNDWVVQIKIILSPLFREMWYDMTAKLNGI